VQGWFTNLFDPLFCHIWKWQSHKRRLREKSECIISYNVLIRFQELFLQEQNNPLKKSRKTNISLHSTLKLHVPEIIHTQVAINLNH
jgi:hypothetical protein